MEMRHLLYLALGSLTVLSLDTAPAAGDSTTEFEREVAYTGQPLEGTVFLCSSDHVTSAAFRRDLGTGTVTEHTYVSTERSVTTWRVAFNGNQAEVIVFQGATQTVEAPERFAVQRNQFGYFLTWQGFESGAQTISIDLSNSSFVYSSQNLHALKNGVNTFVGSCRPHV